MGVKKNEVVYLSVSDGQSYLPGRRLVIRITRQGDKRTSKHYVATGYLPPILHQGRARNA